MISIIPIFVVNLGRVVYIVLRPFVLRCRKRIKKRFLKKKDMGTQKGEFVAYMKA